MKIFRLLTVQMLAIVAFVVLVLCFWEGRDAESTKQAYNEYNEGWIVESPETGQAVLTRNLEEHLESSMYLGFYTSHQLVDVYVEGSQVYQLKNQDVVKSKTPGNVWNFLELKEEYAGKEIQVVLTNCYENSDVTIPDFYFGAKDSIMMRYIRTTIFSLCVSSLILMLGLILVVVYFGVRKTMAVNEAILWLGMFAIPLAIWSGLESQIFTFFTTRYLLVSQLTFMVLKLIAIPILQFASIIYEMRDSKVIKIFCIASILDFWVTSAMQLVGWGDYKETLWLTHVIFISSAVYVIFKTVQILWQRRSRNKKSRRAVMAHGMCVEIVAICVLLDTATFYLNIGMDSAKFSRLGLLFYIIILAYMVLNDSIQLIKAGQKVNVLKKEAETDVMTKVKNRRSFEQDVSELNQNSPEGCEIVLCDLNNLKQFNDIYGHSMGDYYIIICSEVIQDTLGKYGTVYRIGGDEFCAIVQGLGEDRAEELRVQMNDRLRILSGTRFKEPMSVAMGYAAYNKVRDMDLSETVKRADESMYQEKTKMKKHPLREKEK